MAFYSLGILLYVIPQVISALAPKLRARIIDRLAPERAFTLYIAAIALGIVCLGLGYLFVRNSTDVLYAPGIDMQAIASVPLSLGFVSIAAAMSYGHLNRILRTPFAIGVALIAVGVLIDSGETARVIICATVLAVAVMHIVVGWWRPTLSDRAPRLREDVWAVIVGIIVYLLTINGKMDSILPFVIGILIWSAYFLSITSAGEKKE
jgi:uncharacterized membrane protein